MKNKHPPPAHRGSLANIFAVKSGMAVARATAAGHVLLALVLPLSSVDVALAQGSKPQIAVAREIHAEPDSVTPLPIQIRSPNLLPRTSFIRLRGMPPTASLTEGYAIGSGNWAIPLIALPTLKANIPVGTSGRSELAITLVSIEGTVLAEASTTLVIEVQSTSTSAERSRVEHAPKLSSTPSAPVRAEAYQQRPAGPRIPELSAEERANAEKLLALGKQFLGQGNIAVARQFFRRAANAGLADGALSLAATYDPDQLAQFGAHGVVADREEARRWYERAHELGAAANGGR